MAALLTAFLMRTAPRPARWGELDCTLWPADWVKEATGYDPAEPYRGSYATAAECQALLDREGGLMAVVTPRMDSRFQRAHELRAGCVGIIALPFGLAPVAAGMAAAIRGDVTWLVKGLRGFAMYDVPHLAAWQL